MGRQQLHITVILFFSLFFVACKSTRIIRENTWEFLKQNNESVHYYDFDEKLNIHAPEVQEEKKYFIFEPDLISADGTARAYAYGESGADEYYDTVTLNQCTGLKDKNGKLIYEGDIVQFYHDDFLQTMKIVWDNDELDFKAIGLKKSVECYEQDFFYLGYIEKEDSLEVIGNIYENSELLEVENE